MDRIEMPKIQEEKISESHSRFAIGPMYPGYGPTIGNALRRVLLSSITGAAVTSFRVEGIDHEFTSIPHAKEDVLELMINLKSVYFRSFSDEPVKVELSKKGPAVVTAKDFKANSNIEIVNPDAHIITLDKSADFNLEVTVEKGRGFKPVSADGGADRQIGQINVDALFSPVERVIMDITNIRVGQMTNYNQLMLEVITNGSISPNDAIKEASAVLIEHYQAIVGMNEKIEEIPEEDSATEDESIIPSLDEEDESDEVNSKTKVEDLKLSARTTNALVNSGIKTVGGLRRLSTLKTEEIKGLGKKGIDEIKELIG